jgi:hypothetical protein
MNNGGSIMTNATGKRLAEVKKKDISTLFGTHLEQDWYWLQKQAERAIELEEENKKLKEGIYKVSDAVANDVFSPLSALLKNKNEKT